MIEVTLENLHRLFLNPYNILYINGEPVDGMTERELRIAVKNGCEVLCG